MGATGNVRDDRHDANNQSEEKAMNLMDGACAQREPLTSSQPASALRVCVGPTALQEKQQLQKE